MLFYSHFFEGGAGSFFLNQVREGLVPVTSYVCYNDNNFIFQFFLSL